MRSNAILHRPLAPPSWPDYLADWVSAGLVTSDQAEAIRQHETEPHQRGTSLALAPAPAAGPSLVIEALGYLGGVVMLVGAMILASLFWAGTPTAVRLLIIGTTALALIAAGFVVPERLGEAARRLRSVLWVMGVIAVGGFLGTLSVEVLDRRGDHALVIIGPATAVVAGLLWWLKPSWLQQLVLFVALMTSAQGVALELTSSSSSWVGATMWGAAIAWTGLTWAGLLGSRTTGVAFGMLGAVIGSMTMDNNIGIALGLATAVAMVALALWQRSLPWLGVAAIMLLWTTPRAATEWFPGRLSAALTLIVTGGLLVGAAVWVARRPTRNGE